MNVESRWATNEKNKPIALCTTTSSVFLEDGITLENYLKSMGNLEASIVELWSGQQSASATLTLKDDYSKYDIIISQIEVLPDYPRQEHFDFMLKGGNSITGGFCENTTYIAQYRLYDWNATSVYFKIDNKGGGVWNLTLKRIIGIKFKSDIHTYSAEEQVVGTWIDGKPIYEKVICIGNKSANYSFTIDNLEYIVNYTGFLDVNGYRKTVPFIQPQYNNYIMINDYKDSVVNFKTNLSYTDCHIIIQYTKTTD